MEDKIDRFLRVDQAGEIGAVRIYQGQLAVLKSKASTQLIRHMAEQERHHLKTFDTLIEERGARPSLLSPLWHMAGFALGAATAMMGERAAMACTVAVEDVIEEHYAQQAAQLGEDEAVLGKVIDAFRADEQEHRQTALNNGAELSPAYPVLSTVIKAGCRAAIWLAERV